MSGSCGCGAHIQWQQDWRRTGWRRFGDRGFINADKQMRTNVGHIFAACDIIGQPMLAHKAVPKVVLEKSILPLIPIGRLGEPEEIARAVVFLVADEAGASPGATLLTNGGQYKLMLARGWLALQQV